jgi:hypothetical protein
MSSFKELDSEKIWELLKDQENALKPLVDKEEAFFRASSCPNCRGHNFEASIDPRAPFTPGSPLANRFLRCLTCETEFNPYTGLVMRVKASDESDRSAHLAPGPFVPRHWDQE